MIKYSTLGGRSEGKASPKPDVNADGIVRDTPVIEVGGGAMDDSE